MKAEFSRPVIVVLALLVVSLVINGLQGKRILMLEAVLEGRAAPLAVGTNLPPLDLIDARGQHTAVDYRSAPATLIYVFSSSCIWCKHNTVSFRALSHAVRGVRILCLSLSPLDTGAAAASDIGVDFPAYAPSDQTISSYKLAATPTTILVSARGKLLREWSGSYTGSTRAEIEEYFKVRLPEM